MITQKIKNNRGFAILFAITLSAILLSIALGVANIALKELKFSTSNRFTNEAFFAADVGIECAFYNDKSTSNIFNSTSGATSINCSGQPITLTGDFVSVWYFTILGLGNSGQSCARVSVTKTQDFATDPPSLVTTILSKGYNTGDSFCSSPNPNRVEREILVAYGGPASLPPPPPSGSNLTISKAGTGSGTVTSNPIGVSCGSTCSVNFTVDSSVSLLNAPDTGSGFTGWSGDADCADGAVTMSSDINCTATFNTATPVTDTFIASSIWIAPAGVTSVDVELWGGGGRPPYSSSSSGAGRQGGGGGAYAKKMSISVTPGNSYTVRVGSGSTSIIGGSGGDSWFSTSGTVLAKGGTSSTGGSSISSIGDIVFSGGNGGAASGAGGGGGGSSAGTSSIGTNGSSSSSGGAGGVAPTGGGDGGKGGDSGAKGSAGSVHGGGGGGGGASLQAGGNGARGEVRITYMQ